MDKEEIVFLRKVIKAQDKLLMCYRFGRHPPDWIFVVLAKFRELYDKSKPSPNKSFQPTQKTRG